MGRNIPKVITIVLLGSTGTGKSATGNSIIGRNEFESKRFFSGVTTTCKNAFTMVKDHRVLEVIDTPGLFDSNSNPEDVKNEIVKCIDMARDGIHAVLLVVPLARYTVEQVETVETLKHLFGRRILDYIIITFTRGDELEEGETLDDYLANSNPPAALKDVLEQCGNKKVVFDNKTKDKKKKAEQLEQLISVIDKTIIQNEGRPYTKDMLIQNKNEAQEKSLGGSKQKVLTEKEMQALITELVREKLEERNEQIVKELDRKVERLTLEAKHKKEMKASRNEIQRLKVELQRAKREAEKRQGCVVL